MINRKKLKKVSGKKQKILFEGNNRNNPYPNPDNRKYYDTLIKEKELGRRIILVIEESLNKL